MKSATARVSVRSPLPPFRRRPENTTDRDDIRSHGTELWALVGEPTIACIADGCRTLAMLWTSAWKEAGAKAPAAKAADPDVLEKLSMDPDFAPSVYLPDHVRDW